MTATFPYRKTLLGNFLPIIDCRLYRYNKAITVFALVDSGATVSIIRPSVAKILGIELEKGKKVNLGGISGGIKGWLFNIQFEIAGKKFFSPVVFSEQFQSSFNLLGRNGVFEHFKITFDEKNRKIHFS